MVDISTTDDVPNKSLLLVSLYCVQAIGHCITLQSEGKHLIDLNTLDTSGASYVHIAQCT